ncbi:MAG: hypothetical protein HY675_14140 [Chloroflexi bacterium]|nr:hypothetical protein [Chloroflexota bacterium]
MLRIVLLSASILVVALFGAPGVVGAEGVVEGAVVNKTGGESPVKGQEVELKALRQDGSTVATLVTRTDNSGKFRFASLATADSSTYVLSTKFQDVEYQASLKGSEVTESTGKAEIVVYDAANDVGVQVDLSHLVVEVDPATSDLTVLEVAIIQNPSDRTLVPKVRNGQTLWFPLPKGALHPEVTEGLDRVADPNKGVEGLGYAGSVLPGKRQVVYTYMLANPGASFNVSKQMAYPTRKVNVLMADVGQKMSGPKLSSQQPVNIKDRAYLFLTGESLEAGQSVEVNVSNFPPPSAPGRGTGSTDQVRWAVLAVMAAGGLAMVLAYPRVRASRQAALRRARASHQRHTSLLNQR